MRKDRRFTAKKAVELCPQDDLDRVRAMNLALVWYVPLALDLLSTALIRGEDRCTVTSGLEE